MTKNRSITSIKETTDRKYYWAKIADGNLNDYHQYFSEDILKKFAEQASIGVPVLDSHGYGQISKISALNHFGIGRSVSGEYDEKENAVYADFFIVKGLNLSNQSFMDTDSLIKAIDQDIVNNISVGYHQASHICNICDADLWDPEPDGLCIHHPGKRYVMEVDGEKERIKCHASIEKADLVEFSLVHEAINHGREVVLNAPF